MGGIVSGIGGLVGDIFGGGQSAPTQSNVQVYQPAGTAGADTNIQNLLNSNTAAVSGANNPYTANSSNIAQLFQSLFNAPTAGGYNTSAGNAGTAYTNAGNMASNASGQINNSALSLLPGAAQVMQLGLDPQNDLYNRSLQQNTDRANVNNAAYGLTGQQAAGNTNQANKDFNIDWQNNELQRAIAGLSGAGNAITSASGNAINASNLGTTGAGNILQGGATPYNTSGNIYNNQQTALQNYIQQLLGPVTSSQSTIGDLSGYLGQGINSSASGASAALGNFNAQNNAQANLGSGLAGGANLISSIFSGGGGGGSSQAAQEALATSQLGSSYGPAAISSGGVGDFLSSIGSLFSFL